MSRQSQEDTRPAPPVPADADLRGMPFMPLHIQRLLDSDLWALAPPLAFKAAVGLWCKAWGQVPAASIPNNPAIWCTWLHLSAEQWQEVAPHALRGFVLCSDGRLYHRTVAESVLAALPGRREYVAKKSGDAERKAKERNDRRALLAALERKGVPVDVTAKMSQIRQVARDNGLIIDVTSGQAVEVGKASPPHVTRDASVTVTAQREGKEKERGRGRGIDSLPSPSGEGCAPQAGAPPPGEAEGFTLTGDDAPPGTWGPYTPPPCPHEQILALWAEVMPDLTQHETWTGTRADHLRARWREVAAKRRWPDTAAGLHYLRRLFAYCRQSKFLMGQAPTSADRPPFALTLAWLVSPTNWAKVIEGFYHRTP